MSLLSGAHKARCETIEPQRSSRIWCCWACFSNRTRSISRLQKPLQFYSNSSMPVCSKGATVEIHLSPSLPAPRCSAVGGVQRLASKLKMSSNSRARRVLEYRSSQYSGAGLPYISCVSAFPSASGCVYVFVCACLCVLVCLKCTVMALSSSSACHCVCAVIAPIEVSVRNIKRASRRRRRLTNRRTSQPAAAAAAALRAKGKANEQAERTAAASPVCLFVCARWANILRRPFVCLLVGANASAFVWCVVSFVFGVKKENIP